MRTLARLFDLRFANAKSVMGLHGRPLAVKDLHRFSAAMHKLGNNVQQNRMLYDPIYARERIALAHTTNDARLRSLAVRLFESFEPTGERR